MEASIRKINIQTYTIEPNRYELRSGQESGAPTCPFGNHYQWIGFDKKTQEYIRFTKSVFKKLIQQKENNHGKSNLE